MIIAANPTTAHKRGGKRQLISSECMCIYVSVVISIYSVAFLQNYIYTNYDCSHHIVRYELFKGHNLAVINLNEQYFGANACDKK